MAAVVFYLVAIVLAIVCGALRHESLSQPMEPDPEAGLVEPSNPKVDPHRPTPEPFRKAA